MYKNELAIVSIKPELAYGSIGRSRTTNGKLEEIPTNERITYLVNIRSQLFHSIFTTLVG
jgi:hypothetical protein